MTGAEIILALVPVVFWNQITPIGDKISHGVVVAGKKIGRTFKHIKF